MAEAENVHQEEIVTDNGGRGVADEWTAAALAHASVVLALTLSTAGGVGALAGPAVALFIYFHYRQRSRFVAFHALQSCIYQAVGIVGYTALAAVLGGLVAVAWTVSGLLAVVLIGLLMMPFAGVLTVLMVALLVGAPFAWAGYGLYAAYQVYQGRDFRYRWIGEWAEREVRQ